MHIDEDSEYTDEIAMIVEEIIKQRIQGIKNKDGKYVTPAFPKLIYVLDENNCLEGGKYDYITKLCIQCNIKRMYPDYISAKIMRENYNGEVFSCMGCRSFLSPWKKTAQYCKENGEPESEIGKYKWEGRFNQGVVSINLPQIAIEADGDMEQFWLLLNERLNICYKALLLRHTLLEGTLSDSSPIHWQDGAIARMKQGEKIDRYLHDGYSTLSLGYIGIYETVQCLIGKSHTTPEGEQLALKIMKKLRNSCDQWKEETGLGFGLYGTPAESLCYTFARHDREKYGEIPNVTDHGFYSNSYHVFVNESINAFDKLKFESQFQPISSGGAISYVEMPYMMKNPEALEKLVNYIYHTIQYAEFNTKSDYCYECGYEGEVILNKDNHWECPCCGNTNMKRLLVTRRTCGYLGVNDWNEGKRKEMGLRKLHL
jgi:ribonucleoside-triphosphate reductase